MPATIWIQFERDPLPDKDMVTDAGGEPIISRGILIRLLGPEMPTGTHGEHRHGTCELYFRIAGDDPLPCVLVPLHSFRVFILLRMECKGKDTS